MPAAIPFVYIIAGLVIGYFGRRRKMGFWGYFFASLLLTPCIGALLVILSDKHKPKEEDKEKE